MMDGMDFEVGQDTHASTAESNQLTNDFMGVFDNEQDGAINVAEGHGLQNVATAAAQDPSQAHQLHPGEISVVSYNEPMLTGRPSNTLYLTCDDDILSQYQVLVRKQIEVFEAHADDVEYTAQGRNKSIVLGQIGIRCKYCAFLPPKDRARGAFYYPAKLDGVYQASQNIATSHLCELCPYVPPEVRSQLLAMRNMKSSAGTGKKRWAEAVGALGIYEDDHGLRFMTVSEFSNFIERITRTNMKSSFEK